MKPIVFVNAEVFKESVTGNQKSAGEKITNGGEGFLGVEIRNQGPVKEKIREGRNQAAVGAAVVTPKRSVGVEREEGRKNLGD